MFPNILRNFTEWNSLLVVQSLSEDLVHQITQTYPRITKLEVLIFTAQTTNWELLAELQSSLSLLPFRTFATVETMGESQ